MKSGVINAVLAAALVVGAVYVAVAQPQFVAYVEDRLRSIVAIKPPIGNITPTRDLRGTWVSSVPGKALELFGQFTVDDATASVYENGDIELRIEKVDGNTATGLVRIYNLCVFGQLVSPKVSFAIPKTCQDTGFQPATIRVSGSRLDFGTVSGGGATATIQGTYTTDLIYGTASAAVPPYGEIKGVMHLMRKQ